MRDYPYVRYFPRDDTELHDFCFLGPYEWLTRIASPRMVREAIALWQAIVAVNGTAANVIPDAEVKAAVRGSTLPSLDAVPMAGVILAVIARRARKTVPESPESALQWSTYGTPGGQPRLGDILCLLGEGGARVGLYVGEDDLAYHSLGATTGTTVGVDRVAKTGLYAVRRPLYEGVQLGPNGIRLSHDGALV